MLTSIKQRVNREEEEGFTLIELMVVLLIIAILLAIAIPTFLGSRNTANARSMQENLRNALTAEQTEWTSTQAFSDSTTTMGGLESSLTWSTAAATAPGGNTVTVSAGTLSATGSQTDGVVVLSGYAKDGNCYLILQSNDPADTVTGYGISKGACTATEIAAPTTITAPTAGSASAAGDTTGAYYTAW